MNRQNFLGHLTLALAIVIVAAFIGQMRRWESERTTMLVVRHKPTAVVMGDAGMKNESEPEMLVRFKVGTTPEQIEHVAEIFNDQVDDAIETVDGLVVISDTDGLDEQEVAAYRALPFVEYVEPNYEISIDESTLR